MQHRRSLRASFVVTVAAAVGALNTGCSSEPQPITNPPLIECPSAPPTHGSACTASLGSCSYSCTSGGQGTASCPNGVWESQIGTCNPPPPDVVVDVADASDVTTPPDATPTMCPAAAPVRGSACTAGTTALTCNYGDCFGSPTIMARCTAGAWDLLEVSCNPPPDVPMVTDATADAASDAANDTTSDSAADASRCPDAEPADGAACASPGVTCMYGMCGPTGGRQTQASCDSTGRWSTATLICNPPLVLDAGPDA